MVYKSYYVFVQADGTEEPRFKRNVYCHYDVVLSADESVPLIPSYTGDASTSAAADSIIIT